MSLSTATESGYHAIRNSAALAEEPELRCLKLTGDQAFEALDAVCPCAVFLRDGQMKHTLLLDGNGLAFADIYICREGGSAYLLGYGPEAAEISDWIRGHGEGVTELSIADLSRSHANLAIDGPYAWELCAEVLGSDVLGLPYLGMRSIGEVLVFRAGRCGEYGYHLVVPSHQRSAWLQKLQAAGAAFQMVCASEAARAQCVLENFFFDVNREGKYGLTPMELQLQWRLSPGKTGFPGAEAIGTLRESGWTRRLTCFVTPESVSADQEITCHGKRVGRILAVGYSPLRGEHTGKALLDRPYWHPGLDAFRAGGCHLRTISTPAVKNLSLRVSPYRHSFHTREEVSA